LVEPGTISRLGFGAGISECLLSRVRVRSIVRISDDPNPVSASNRIAGLAAMAHFTMNVTIDQNGIRMSVTTTSCRESGVGIGALAQRQMKCVG
jgi:carbon monoxide dehydrogenase subunit G